MTINLFYVPIKLAVSGFFIINKRDTLEMAFLCALFAKTKHTHFQVNKGKFGFIDVGDKNGRKIIL